MDVNVKTYKKNNGTISIVISIQQTDCQNYIFGVISPIKFELKLRTIHKLISKR